MRNNPHHQTNVRFNINHFILKKVMEFSSISDLRTYNILRRKVKGDVSMMVKEFNVSYEIEQFDENLINMMKMLGQFKLVKTVKHPKPIWADEWYIERQTLTYTWTVTGNVEMAENLYQLAMNNDLLN